MVGIMIPKEFLLYTSEVLADTNDGLTTTRILSLCSRFAVEYNVSILHAIGSTDFPNKRSALFDNICCFQPEQQFKLLIELCSEPTQVNRPEVDELRQLLYARFGELDSAGKGYNEILVSETRHWLSDYPDALQCYEAAIEKRNASVYQRNLLDDLRLSLELLLKRVFNNDKSLENQMPLMGTFVQKTGGSVEYCNMFKKLLDYFCKYQNEHVKHDDSISDNEIDFIVDISSAFMRTIVKCAKR